MPVAFGLFGALLIRFSIMILMLVSGVFMVGLSLWLSVFFFPIQENVEGVLSEPID